MRYKINKSALLSRMGELGQNKVQRVCFFRHNLSVLMNVHEWSLFDSVALGYGLYYMLLEDSFDLIRLKYSDYIVIAQSTHYEYIVELRKVKS